MVKIFKCLRCGYEWASRKARPPRCAGAFCRSPYWDQPLQRKKAEGAAVEPKAVPAPRPRLRLPQTRAQPAVGEQDRVRYEKLE